MIRDSRIKKSEKEAPFGKQRVPLLAAKKSLGQHFLASPHYVKLIADAGDLKKGDCVLEIGPGKGVLTAELLSRGARVIAVEKDSRLIPLLQETFERAIASGQLQLVEMDALEFEPDVYRLSPGRYKLVANIPYYITGALLRKFLSGPAKPSRAVLLLQKEVAERVVRNKKESLLSLSVKAYGRPLYIKTVPRGAFAPAPKVDSSILLIEAISSQNFKTASHERLFFELIRAGFAKKRKLLRRNLETVLGIHAEKRIESAGIQLNARAEDVPLEKWLVLAEESENTGKNG